MMDQVFGEPFSANEYDADPMVAMSELERAIQDRLAEHELRFTAARRVINVNDAQNEPINTAAVVSIPSISPTPTPSTSGMNAVSKPNPAEIFRYRMNESMSSCSPAKKMR
jgi:hypothetical protein